VKGKIFISYRRASNIWAIERLYEVLADKFGPGDVFFDRTSIEPGADWLASLDREVSQASAVVMVFSKEWAGDKPDGARRIDQVDDMVRRELVTANQHGRPIFPVIIDDSPPPRDADLPEGLRFVLKRQFSRLVPATETFQAECRKLTQSIASAQPGKAWGRRFLWQVSWMALGVGSAVAAWHAMGGSDTYANAFARGAIATRVNLSLDNAAQSRADLDVALIEVNDLDHQTALGGSRRYDPVLASIVLRSLTNASRESKNCRDNAPVALNLDLAPDQDRADDNALAALQNGLVELAACRPLVLACPRSVQLNLAPAEDMKWMNRLLAQVPERLVFTQAALDPRGLRHSTARAEPGLALADIAASPSDALQRLRAMQRESCVCPLSPQALAECRQTEALVRWDPRNMAVPFEGRSWPLAHAMPNLVSLAEKRFVLVGEAHGTQARYATPGLRGGHTNSVSETLMQAYFLNGAVAHAAVQGRSWMALLSVFFSWLVAAWVLHIGARLGRHDAQFSRRIPVYVVAGLVMAAVPLLALVVAARYPSFTWLAGLFTVVGVLTLGRALLACFEVLLHGGIAWKSMSEQIDDIRFDLDTRSAVLSFCGTLAERVVMIGCLLVAVWASVYGAAGGGPSG
jgi:TIR domain